MTFKFFSYFSEKTSLDISCESSAKQMIHMKCQDLFSLKNKKKKKIKKKLSSAAVVIGALRVKGSEYTFYKGDNFCDFPFAFLHTKPLLKRGIL